MTNYKGTYDFQVTDFNGDVATVRFPVISSGTATIANLVTNAGTLETALAAATNGKVTRQGFSVLFNEAQYLVGTAPPNNAEYSSVTDGARLQFADGGGERMSVTIPAPLEALFGANSNVVDSTQTDVAAIIAAVASICNSLSGSFFNLYKGGIKVGKRARRRRSPLIP